MKKVQKADELKTKVQVLTQQASDKTMECSSLCKEKENLANELENVNMKKQKKHRIEAVHGMATDLLCCDNLEVTGVQLRNKDTGSTEVVQVNKQSEKENIYQKTL